MDLFLKLLQLCVILSSLHLSISQQLTYPTYNTNNKKYRRINVATNTESNCFCFESTATSKSVLEQLGSNGNNIERLVVYLYKDKKTAEIKMYTPSVKKQSLIPDLFVEDGDNLQIIDSNDKVADVFTNNQNAVTVTSYNKYTVNTAGITSSVDNGQNQQAGLSDVPIGTNFGKIEHVTSKLGLHNFENEARNLYINPNLSPSQVYWTGNQDMVKTSASNPCPNSGNQPCAGNSAKGNQPVINYSVLNKPSINHNVYKPSFDDQQRYNYFTNSQQRQPGGATPTFNKWFEQQMNRVQKSTSTQSHSIDVNILKNLIEKTLTENGMVVSSNGILTDSNGNNFDMSNLQLRPILIGDTLGYEQFMKAKIDTFNLPSDMPYLESVLVTLVHPPKILGIVPIGKTYLPNSPKSDIQGQKNDTRRRYYYLSQLPTENSYQQLSNSLMTLFSRRSNKPQKDSSTYNNAIKSPVKMKTVPIKFDDTKGKKKAQLTGNEEESKDEVNFKPQNLAKDHEVNFEEAIWNPINMNAEDTTTINVHDSSNTDVEKNQETDKNEDSLNIVNSNSRHASIVELKSLVKTLTKLLSKNDIPEKHFNGKYGYDKYTPSVNPSDPDEQPGFRIIGGYAATSSGLPISNRGRSGFII